MAKPIRKRKSIANRLPRLENPPPGVEGPDSGEIIDMDAAITLLGTSRPTFYRWVRAGKIKSMKAGRQWRFYRADIERFLRGDEPRVEVTGDLSGFMSALHHKFKQYDLKITGSASHPGLSEAIDGMIRIAVCARASDIHLDPPAGGDEKPRFRVRIDGVLHEIMRFDSRLLPSLVDRLKSMAACDPAQKKRPQDGRIVCTVEKKEVDLRVSFLPAVLGEAVTLRILRREGVSFRLDQLNFSPAGLQRVRQALALPWGLMLFTGPTGSGKTTSMYAALHELNTSQRKVMTVEDPVEYLFPGMVQVAINPRENTTFASVLRAFLRSDPDVMMVGEIRDRETAQLCAQSALTGHLVLTQLHTDETAAALARLVDLGLDPFMVVDTVKLVVSQRLVRALCKQCSVPTEPAADQLAEAARLAREDGISWDNLPRHFRKAAGCKECGFTGYRGRLMVAEVLTMSPSLAEAVRKGTSVAELRRVAVSQGMTTMTADALSRAAEGRVLLDEAMRVLPD